MSIYKLSWVRAKHFLQFHIIDFSSIFDPVVQGYCVQKDEGNYDNANNDCNDHSTIVEILLVQDLFLDDKREFC